MAGSKSIVSVVLAYNVREDKAKWFIPSQLSRLQQVDPHWRRIYEDHESYEGLAAMAGPKPVVIVEEI